MSFLILRHMLFFLLRHDTADVIIFASLPLIPHAFIADMYTQTPARGYAALMLRLFAAYDALMLAAFSPCRQPRTSTERHAVHCFSLRYAICCYASFAYVAILPLIFSLTLINVASHIPVY